MNEENNILSVQLLINGTESNAMIKKIDIEKNVNNISESIIELQEGNQANEDFSLSNSSEFVPGNAIEIKAGYNSKENTIFKGIILGQTISVDNAGSSLILTCKHKVITASKAKKNKCFLNCTDSDIVSEILGDYAVSKSIESTSVTYEKVVQFGVTDWDFIISRAAINGLVVIVEEDHLIITSPAISDAPVVSLIYGQDIFELNLTVSSEDQLETVEAAAWDASTQSIVQEKSLEPTVNKEGNLTGQKLAEVLNVNIGLQSSIPLDKEALKTRANSKLLNSRLSRIQGSILCQGNASIKPNTLVNINSVGQRLNGDAYVSGVSHNIQDGQWFTEIKIGLQQDNITAETLVNVIDSVDELSGMNGLHIGRVKKINSDPANEFRVLVDLPLIDISNEGIWARLSTMYASSGFGSFFYPEIGDEVILGFLNNNPSAPIILGSVYSKANVPKFVPDENNSHKAIITKSGMSIDFDEENKIIMIETAGQNKIILSDKENGITITDQNNNSVKLSDTGIVMNSDNDIVIKAANNLSLEGANVTVKASTDLNMSSLTCKVNAGNSFIAEGGASAELKSSGNVAVKGAIVELN